MADSVEQLVHKVVDAHELEEATSSGWDVKDVLSETATSFHSVDQPHPFPGQQTNGTYNSDTIACQHPYENTVHRFLLVKSVDSIITELKAELEAGVEALKEGGKTIEVAAKEVALANGAQATAEGKVQSLEETIKQLEADAEATKEVAKVATTLKGRAEAMLDTVRQEIGTQALKRILAEAELDDGQSLEDLLKEISG